MASASKLPPGTKPLTVNVGEDLHQRLKTGSVLLGSNMGAVISALIDQYMPVVVDGVPKWDDKRRKELVKLLNES